MKGTWDLDDSAKDASVWMFVYPRQPELVQNYLTKFGEGKVGSIIWLGPKSDWGDYSAVAESWRDLWSVEEVGDCGLVEYEMMMVWRKAKSRQE